MWLFCGGMQRSGSTLQYQIVSKIVEDFNLGKKVEFDKPEFFNKIREKHRGYKKYKVFKSHKLNQSIRSEFDDNAKAVYIYRDIRDVIVSLMFKQEKSFDFFFERKIIEKLLTTHSKWIAINNVLISKYEDVENDIKIEVKRIAAFLNISIKDTYADYIAYEFGLEKQQQRINDFLGKKEYIERIGKNKVKKIFDPKSLLHHNHITQYKKKGWINNLKHEQIRKVEEIAGDWLLKNGYELYDHSDR